MYISFVIVNYNGRKWLPKFFDSFKNQSDQDYEIVFVDNNSSDDSIEYVKSLKSSKIKVIALDKNLGFAGANNVGIENAQYENICLINNDTWFESDFIKKLEDFYINNKYDVVAPYERGYDENSSQEPYVIKIDITGHPIYFRNKVDHDGGFYLSGVCLLFSKKLYYDTFGLDNDFFMYFEEIDWFWRLHLFNKNTSHIPNLFIHHYGAGSTGTGIKYKSFLWRNQNTLQMLLKNQSVIYLTFILPFYFLQNIFEILFFIFTGKPKISYSYLEGWLYNIKIIQSTLKKRNIISKMRLVKNKVIFKKMYFGLAKLHHLLTYLKMKTNQTHMG